MLKVSVHFSINIFKVTEHWGRGFETSIYEDLLFCWERSEEKSAECQRKTISPPPKSVVKKLIVGRSSNTWFSTNSFVQNKNTCNLTWVNFITEDQMLWCTYLYENTMFTKKMSRSIIWERKCCAWVVGEVYVVVLVKSLIYARVWKGRSL